MTTNEVNKWILNALLVTLTLHGISILYEKYIAEVPELKESSKGLTEDECHEIAMKFIKQTEENLCKKYEEMK